MHIKITSERLFLMFGEVQSQKQLLPEQTLEQDNNMDLVISLAERLDFLDIQILRKFYMTGKDFPLDCQPYCFPLLYIEMKAANKLKVGVEALRKRLGALVKIELLEKINHSNPTSYSPVRDKSPFVRAIITKFFVISGLTKFL